MAAIKVNAQLVDNFLKAAKEYEDDASDATDQAYEEAYVALKDVKLAVHPDKKDAFDAAFKHAAEQYGDL